MMTKTVMLFTSFEKPNMKSGQSRKVALSMKLFTETENGLSRSSEIMTIAIPAPTTPPTTAPLIVLVMILIDSSITALGLSCRATAGLECPG